MAKYVALLRGIGPSNPNMHGSKLKSVLEDLGFNNVQTLISSGNVLFESNSKDQSKMEANMEKAWPDKLGFKSTTIVRSQEQLQAIARKDPFKGKVDEHNKKIYLLVTFFKKPQPVKFKLPHTPTGKSFTIVGSQADGLYSTVDLSGAKTPDLMTWLEKEFTKDITSRTWNTLQRILKKME